VSYLPQPVRQGRDRPQSYAKQYKENLSVLNGRYSDLEQRVLRFFAKHPDADEIELPGMLDILLMYLLEDGLLAAVNPKSRGVGRTSGVPFIGIKLYRPTGKGRQFIKKWLGAETLE
jgi:hypothetical protein